MTLKTRRKPAKAKRAKLHRPSMPDRVKLAAALLQGIVDPSGAILHKGDGQWDHDPALELRAYNEKTKKYTPDANDPNFIVYRETAAHAKKTHGPGGEKRITTKGSDNQIAKQIDRLKDANREHAKAMSTKGVGSKSHSDYLARMAKAGKPVPQRRM